MTLVAHHSNCHAYFNKDLWILIRLYVCIERRKRDAVVFITLLVTGSVESLGGLFMSDITLDNLFSSAMGYTIICMFFEFCFNYFMRYLSDSFFFLLM